MKQIILITDGLSNVGISPVIAAAHAKAEGIIVNVIGLVDSDGFDDAAQEEVTGIAHAGGGMSRMISKSKLSQTVQMMTRQTVTQTIQQAVGKELSNILGNDRLESLPPEQRAKVVQVMDELSETAALKIALLIDTSASMKSKLHAVKEAIYDLQLSLQARSGVSETAVFHFPASADSSREVEMDLAWTRDLANLNRLFYKLNMKGTTPTGPALTKVVHFMTDGEELSGAGPRGSKRNGPARLSTSKDGILSDYVV
ncbi:vWA domain-containing protein [Paenibacillus xerothermodurans]|uniref:VWFA domain-containing protein n=1 Tax=Paenibacillus xerothermodurans TaxID=1977292 RepID=A0A2W1NWL1_PAEXE|nr:vWA domain-containing protein [Paenibacillus xerothermodurans]PZE19218.1 hypothetical protein CBW46_019820 [Paenibacillus xerothermodurans]